jgi:hypothetical protein
MLIEALKPELWLLEERRAGLIVTNDPSDGGLAPILSSDAREKANEERSPPQPALVWRDDEVADLDLVFG